MTAQMPKGTRAERVAFARRWIRNRRAEQPSVRLPRAVRRVIVVALYLFLAATVTVLAAGPAAVSLPYLVMLVVGQVVCYVLLNYSVRGIFAGHPDVDEREKQLRREATTIAYAILATTLGLLAIYAVVAPQLRLGIPQLLWLLITMSWLAFSLPQAVFAWTLPDAD